MDDRVRARLDAFLAQAGKRSLLMGILNVTPDSFSDGGRFDAPATAVAQANAMVRAGAAILDVGGESTRPGFTPVPSEEELRRIVPVIEALGEHLPVPVSIDTTKPDVARRALTLGACVVNDIWGFHGDPGLADAVAEAGAAAVLMHNRARQDEAIDIVDDMRRFFDRSLAIAARAGVARHHIVLDPGIGFGKTQRQQLAAIKGISRLLDYGLPVRGGVSRKAWLGHTPGAAPGTRLVETIAANLAAADAGATIFRVHDVAEHAAALKVFDAVRDLAEP